MGNCTVYKEADIINMVVIWWYKLVKHINVASGKVNFTLEQATKAQRGSSGIALLCQSRR